ncbi:PAS domain S-box protein, partial [Candidatus Omnitrophota bacterium]
MKRNKANILIVGAGKGGIALVEMFQHSDAVHIAGVVDINPEAPGIALAKKLGIPVAREYEKFLSAKDLHEVFDVTGSKKVQAQLSQRKPANVKLISGSSAKLVWNMIEQYRDTADALKETAEEYRRLAEGLKDVVVRISPAGVVEYCSPAVKDFGGYDPKRVMGSYIGKYFAHKKELMRALQLIGKAMLYKEGVAIEFLYKPKKKKPFYVEATGMPIIRENKVVTIQCVLRDISERKKNEEIIRESEERFRQVAEQSLEWIWEVDTNGLYTYVSPMVKKILGYAPEELIGRKYFYDLFLQDEREKLKEEALKVFSKK